MHRETPIRRSPLPGGLPRGPENSNRYTARIEFPVSHRKQRTDANPNRYTNPDSFVNFAKINRHTELVESPVSHSKQRPGPQINRHIFRAPLTRPMAFTTHQSQITNHGKINRHIFLLEFAVTYRKQSSSQNLLATRMAFFPHPPKPLLATRQCRPSRTLFSSTSSASYASFASYLARLCVTISGGEAACRI